jgi:DNA-binding MarR family transcriptional regulator
MARRSARSRGRKAAATLRRQQAAEVVKGLRRLFKGIHEYSKAMQRHSGLSAPQAWALTLVEGEAGVSLGTLAERMYAHPSTVSGVVERLVNRGALRRERDPEDRRGIRLSLTPAGRRLLRESPPPVQAGLLRALERMPLRRLRLLSQALEEIVHQAELERVEAPFFES